MTFQTIAGDRLIYTTTGDNLDAMTRADQVKGAFRSPFGHFSTRKLNASYITAGITMAQTWFTVIEPNESAHPGIDLAFTHDSLRRDDADTLLSAMESGSAKPRISCSRLPE